MSSAPRSRRTSRLEKPLPSSSRRGPRNSRRRLALEPLDSRLVLSAGGLREIPHELGSHGPALVADHDVGPRIAPAAAFGPGGLSSSSELTARAGAPLGLTVPARPRFGRPATASSHHGVVGFGTVVATPARSAAVGDLNPPSTFGTGRVFLLIVEAPAMSQLETPVVSTRPAMMPMDSAVEAAAIAAPFVVSEFGESMVMASQAPGVGTLGASATTQSAALSGFASGLQASQSTSGTIDNSASLGWIPTTPAAPNPTSETTRTPGAMLMPDNPLRPNTQNEEGLIELESPRTRRGGTSPDEEPGDAWQPSSPQELDEAVDLEWLWSELEGSMLDEKDGESADASGTVEDESTHAIAGGSLAVGAHSSSDGTSEGGMIELVAGEASIDLPNHAYAAHDIEPIGDSQVRMEAGVALVRVFDVATTAGEESSSDSAAPLPVDVPPADETSASDPSETTNRPATTGAMLMAIPSMRRRPTRDGESGKSPRR